MKVTLENRAKLACLYAGLVWGLFWIPIRMLEDAGIHGLWITVVYFLVPAICLVPLSVWRFRYIKVGGLRLQITAMLAGVALLLYTMSIVYTEVVHALLLFYLTPLWGTILARIYLREEITPQRLSAMVIAIIGALTIFGLGVQFPMPQNVGDWMGLSAGMLWAIASLRINMFKEASAKELTLGFFFWSLVFSTLAAFIISPTHVPSISQILPTLPFVILFTLVLILPSTFAFLWGPKFLSPGIVGLLFMTEIVTGSISVALLSGEPFGTREVIGTLLIIGASLIEPVNSLIGLERFFRFPRN